MKKFIKTFGERPEEVVVLKTKVFFDADGIAEVEDEEVMAVLEAVPGYELVSEGESEGEGEKTPQKPADEPVDPPSNEGEQEDPPADENPADESTSEEGNSEDEDEEDTSEDETDEEEVEAKPIKKPGRAPRRPSTPTK